MKPCKHLDYTEGKYRDCTIQHASGIPGVRYWLRGETWTNGGRNPDKVQFCGQGRGRINGVLACYNGEMSCYEPEEAEEPGAGPPDNWESSPFAQS